MQSVLNEIARLRGGKSYTIDYHNSNRYRLVVQEQDGSKTAYYFSTPIYNQKDGKLLDVKFRRNGNTIGAVGSNTDITVSQNVVMENEEVSCVIELKQKVEFVSTQKLRCGKHTIWPTTNGVAMKCVVSGDEKLSFLLEAGQPILKVRSNSKYFALMRERFRPYVVFSCLASMDATGNVIAPAKLEYQKITDKKYCITVSATSPLARYLLWECNLYENKLFQDTTVESGNPSSNNAFGSVGFIGNTAAYGEQWLYTRLDYSRMPEVMDKHICKAILHIPKLNHSKVKICTYRVAARFCSFGSNWDNKIASTTFISDAYSNSGYQNIDMTSLLVNSRTGIITKTEGLILKPQIKGNGFSAIATADSYLAPQIIEINFK